MAKSKRAKPTKKRKTASSTPAGVIELGDRRELFVDDYLIERLHGVELRLQKPVPRNVAIDHDAPWEGNTSGYHTVFQDDNLFRAYYRGSHYGPSGAYTPVVCYAESRDGIEWYRPELGLVNYKGSTRNNIIWDGPGSLNFTPFRDRNPNCREGEEYKALGSPSAQPRRAGPLRLQIAGRRALEPAVGETGDGPHRGGQCFRFAEPSLLRPAARLLRRISPRLHLPRRCALSPDHDLYLNGLPPLDEAAITRLRRRTP